MYVSRSTYFLAITAFNKMHCDLRRFLDKLHERCDDLRRHLWLVGLFNEFSEAGEDGQGFSLVPGFCRLPAESAINEIADVEETVVAFGEVEFI